MRRSSLVRDLAVLHRLVGALAFTLIIALAVPLLAVPSSPHVVPSSSTAASDRQPAIVPMAHTSVLSPRERNQRLLDRCDNRLIRVLWRAGFRGANLREAWAIARRESGGRPRAVSSTGDIGLFQFNSATWSDEPWWDRERLLRAHPNARAAARLSERGKNWYPWGLTGSGKPNARAYFASGWSRDQVRARIVIPYRKQLHAFDSLPRPCRRLADR